jgi:hypothetical protein
VQDRRIVAAVVVGLVLLVIFVIVKNTGGGGDSVAGLTVCERAWQEADRNVREAGPENDIGMMVQPTLTACDTVAEWDAANVKVGSKVAEGAVEINSLCDRLGVTDRPLCTDAKQRAAPAG